MKWSIAVIILLWSAMSMAQETSTPTPSVTPTPSIPIAYNRSTGWRLVQPAITPGVGLIANNADTASFRPMRACANTGTIAANDPLKVVTVIWRWPMPNTAYAVECHSENQSPTPGQTPSTAYVSDAIVLTKTIAQVTVSVLNRDGSQDRSADVCCSATY